MTFKYARGSDHVWHIIVAERLGCAVGIPLPFVGMAHRDHVLDDEVKCRVCFELPPMEVRCWLCGRKDAVVVPLTACDDPDVCSKPLGPHARVECKCGARGSTMVGTDGEDALRLAEYRWAEPERVAEAMASDALEEAWRQVR